MVDFPFDPEAVDWTPANCYALAQMAELAYSEPHEIDARCIALGFDDVRHFSSAISDLQAFLAARPDVVILAFRGTEPDKLRDWLVAVSVDLRWMPGLGRVHGGFRNSYRSVHDNLRELSELWLHRPLFVCGHSRGAAEATLAAWSLLNTTIQPVQLYTFGSPRLLDSDSVETFNHQFAGRSFRMVNNTDGVVRVPTRLHGYWHVDEAIVADREGRWMRGSPWWERLLRHVESAWQDWVNGHKPEFVMRHSIDEYVRISKLNYERQTL